MKYLIITFAIALIAMAAPLSTYSHGEEVHHQEKAAKAKQAKAKATPKKRKKTPPAKSERTNKVK